MKHSIEEICSNFDININDILNVYCYGSRVYGNNTIESDYDYILVYKQSMLTDNSFKSNAKSSKDRSIQIINYSRGGFKAGIENYDISVLECLYLPSEFIIQEKIKYSLDKFNHKVLANKIISKASNSWHLASLAFKDQNYEHAKKGFYHSLRILDFGNQIQNYKKIVDYSTAIKIKENVFEIFNNNDHNLIKFVIQNDLIKKRDLLFETLRF